MAFNQRPASAYPQMANSMFPQQPPFRKPPFGGPRPRTSPPGGATAPRVEDVKLDSRTINQKTANRVFVEVLKNNRGNYFRISQELRRPQRLNMFAPPRQPRFFARVVLSPESANELSNILLDFIPAAAEAEKNQPKGQPPAQFDPRQSIKSDNIRTNNKRYFIDLKHTRTGPLFRISEVNDVRQSRDFILVFDMAAIDQISKALDELLKKYPPNPDLLKSLDNLPDPRSLKIEGPGRRMLYFDLDVNQRNAISLRISDIRQGLRNVIMLPEGSWENVKYIISTYQQELKDLRTQGSLPPPPAPAPAGPGSPGANANGSS